jgi:DNA polymerase-1
LGWEDIKNPNNKGICVGQKDISLFLREHSQVVFVGHGSINFDYPVLERLLGISFSRPSRLLDTLVLSTLYNPSLEGGHSLSEWGQRLKMPKREYDFFENGYTPQMGLYCQQDVSITAELFRRITKVLKKIGFSEFTCQLQHSIARIIKQQQINGFQFNIQEAIVLYQHLRQLEAELEEQVHNVFPPKISFVRSGPIYRKDGSVRAQFIRDQQNLTVRTTGNTYEAYQSTPFNLGSPSQRTERLQELGWVNLPDEVTKTGKPKPFDKGDLVPSLKEFLEQNPTPEIEYIAKWLSYNARANMINTWMEAFNEDTGRIHGKLFVADTLRFRHQSPNTANIPAVRVTNDGQPLLKEAGYYTYEARDLWTARPGRVLVGTDAAGLELRMLAHFLNRKEFTKQVVEGDPHQYNADLAGVSRPTAKTLLYAIQYGAQAKKVASIIKASQKEGAALREQFLERLGLKGLMENAISEQKSGRVWLVCGAGVVCPSPHAALNYKLQGSGARVMALAASFLEHHIRRNGLDSLKVGDIHDEWQYDVAPEDAQEHARLSLLSLREAGEELNLNVRIDGTAKKGLTWAQTH